MDLAPSAELEMMVKRAHFEHPFPGELEGSHLDNDGKRFQYENHAQENEKELCPGHNGNTCNGAAQSQGTGVPHENLGGMVVEEKEADAGACQNNKIKKLGHIPTIFFSFIAKLR